MEMLKSFRFRSLAAKFLLVALSANALLFISAGADGPDTDVDGMDDNWESTYACTSAFVNDPSNATVDVDVDGLTNLDEYTRGTDPCTADTDGDGRNDGAEVTEGTNPAVSEMPDLELTSYEINEDNTFAFTVTNTGNYAVDPTLLPKLSFYYDYPSTGSLAEEIDLNTQVTAYQAIGGSISFNSTYALDGTVLSVGMLAVVDSFGIVQEATESVFEANYYRKFFAYNIADLMVSDLSLDASGNLVYTVSNLGGASVDTATLSSNTIAVDGTVLSTEAWGTLSDLSWLTKSSIAVNLTSTVLLADGVHSAEVCIDSAELVTEFTEGNNCLTENFIVGMPDLTVSNVQLWDVAANDFIALTDVPADADPLDYSFYYTVSNLGTVDVGTADETVIGFTEVTQDDVLVISFPWSNLGNWDFLKAAGSSSFSADEVTVSNDILSGATSLEFCVDTSDTVTEADETNNCYGVDNPFEAAPPALPDLAMSNVQLWDVAANDFIALDAVPEDADPLDYSFYYTVSNLGTVDVGTADATVIGFTEVTQDDVLVISFPWNNLGNWDFLKAAGSSSFSADEVTVSNDVLSGATVLTFCVDTSNTVTETDETNNCITLNNPFVLVPATPTDTGSSGSGSTSTSSSGGSSGPGFVAGVSYIPQGSEDVTLTEDEMEDCGTMTFVDVTTDNPNYENIYRMWCEGVIHGRDSTHFAPTDAIRRDEVSKIIARLFGYVTLSNGALPQVTHTDFKDLSTVEVLAYYVQLLTDKGFFNVSKTLGFFRPHDKMTYTEIITLLSQVSNKKVSLSGYGSNDSMDRGTFATLAFSLFE